MSLVVSEEQGLALKSQDTVVAEMTCTFEGKDRLCPRLLLVAARPLLRVG